MATELQALRASHDRLIVTLAKAREFVQAEHDHLLESFCVMRDGEPDLSTLDDDDRPHVQKAVDMLAAIDSATAESIWRAVKARETR